MGGATRSAEAEKMPADSTLVHSQMAVKGPRETRTDTTQDQTKRPRRTLSAASVDAKACEPTPPPPPIFSIGVGVFLVFLSCFMSGFSSS